MTHLANLCSTCMTFAILNDFLTHACTWPRCSEHRCNMQPSDSRGAYLAGGGGGSDMAVSRESLPSRPVVVFFNLKLSKVPCFWKKCAQIVSIYMVKMQFIELQRKTLQYQYVLLCRKLVCCIAYGMSA